MQSLILTENYIINKSKQKNKVGKYLVYYIYRNAPKHILL